MQRIVSENFRDGESALSTIAPTIEAYLSLTDPEGQALRRVLEVETLFGLDIVRAVAQEFVALPWVQQACADPDSLRSIPGVAERLFPRDHLDLLAGGYAAERASGFRRCREDIIPLELIFFLYYRYHARFAHELFRIYGRRPAELESSALVLTRAVLANLSMAVEAYAA